MSDKLPLETNSAERKESPVTTGFFQYFPRAIMAVARLSKLGNDKHNPGQPLHWSRGKSNDHLDCAGRHLLEAGTVDTSYTDEEVLHSTELAWRAMANLEVELEAREKAKQDTRGMGDIRKELYGRSPAVDMKPDV